MNDTFMSRQYASIYLHEYVMPNPTDYDKHNTRDGVGDDKIVSER